MEEQKTTRAARPGKKWELIGALGVIAGFLIAQGSTEIGAPVLMGGLVVFIVGRFK